MLCEGVLHYFLIVKVFGGGVAVQVKYFYIFGWGKFTFHCFTFDSKTNTQTQAILYLTIPRARVGYEMEDSQVDATRLVGYNDLISNKRE